MSNWAEGYVTEIEYTHGFYRELSPNFIQTVLRAKQLAMKGSRLNYCELGCGHGFTTNVLAAANPHVHFVGVDFNPDHIAGAKALASEAHLENVHFIEDTFANLTSRDDLAGEFDFIVLHGIYSWVSADSRRQICQFIADRLASGGVVYISYNCEPGWAAASGLRRILFDAASHDQGSVLARVERALTFAGRLSDVSARYFLANPTLKARLEGLSKQASNYLVHEYLNENWSPFYFADVASELSAAKLSFACSAALIDHIDVLNFSEQQLALLGEFDDVVRRESVKDVLLNQQFRRDLFVRGKVRVAAQLAISEWLDTRFALVVARDTLKNVVTTHRGEAALNETIYDPLLDELAKGPKTLREIMAASSMAHVSVTQAIQALTIKLGSGHLEQCHPDNIAQTAYAATGRLNDAICRRAEVGSELAFLASPVTGSGVRANRIEQLFVSANKSGIGDPVDWIQRTLKSGGQHLVKEGKPLTDDSATKDELTRSFEEFKNQRQSLFTQLGVL